MNTTPPEEAGQPPELRLYGEQDLSALHALADPSQLAMLGLYVCDLSDLGPLAGLSQLTTLAGFRATPSCHAAKMGPRDIHSCWGRLRNHCASRETRAARRRDWR